MRLVGVGSECGSNRGGGVGGAPPPRSVPSVARRLYPTFSHSATQFLSNLPLGRSEAPPRRCGRCPHPPLAFAPDVPAPAALARSGRGRRGRRRRAARLGRLFERGIGQ